MPLPAGITTATVTFGKAHGVLGTEATITGTVAVDRPIVWSATGDMLYTYGDPVTSGPGNFLSFQFPHVDQAGFVDEGGHAVTNFAGILTATITFAKQSFKVTKPFQVFAGQTSVDLDLVPGGSIVPGVTAPSAAVLSVAGETGNVDADSLKAAIGAMSVTELETVLPAKMTDPADPVGGALSASIAQIGAPLFVPRTPGVVTVIDGDSNWENGGGRGTSARARRPGSPWPWAMEMSGQRLQVVNNAAVGGQTTTDMLARQEAHVLAHKPDVIVMGCGTNDSGTDAGAPYVPLATTQANILAYIDRAQAAGVGLIILATDPPRNTRSGASRENALRLNAWKRSLPTIRRGVVILDAYELLADAAVADNWVPAYVHPSDGTHYSGMGAHIVGKRLAEIINQHVSARSAVSGVMGDPTNALASFTSWAGAAAGTAPTGWTASQPSYIQGLVASTDGITNPWLHIKVPNDGSFVLTRNGDILAEGQTGIISVEYRLENPQSPAPATRRFWAGLSVAPSFFQINSMSADGTDQLHPWVARSGVAMMPPYTRQASDTQARPAINVAGGCDLYLRRPTCVRY